MHNKPNLKILLVKLNRDYLTHHLFRGSVEEAYDNLVSDIKQWQEKKGIFFKCELIEYTDYNIDAKVTAVVAKFESEDDLMWYKLSMGNKNKVATEFDKNEFGSIVFSNWKDFYDKAEIY